MSAARWERLRLSLEAAGIVAKVDGRSFSDMLWGRVRHGVSRSITIRANGGRLVQIHDQWWSKNPEVWTGWVVDHSGADGILIASRSSKKRSEVVAAIVSALASTGTEHIGCSHQGHLEVSDCATTATQASVLGGAA